MRRLFEAEHAKNFATLKAAFNTSLSYIGFPQGQIYPQDEYSYDQLMRGMQQRFAAQQLESRSVDWIFESCGNAVVSSAQVLHLAVSATQGEFSANKYLDFYQLNHGSNGKTVLGWLHFYWNQINTY